MPNAESIASYVTETLQPPYLSAPRRPQHTHGCLQRTSKRYGHESPSVLTNIDQLPQPWAVTFSFSDAYTFAQPDLDSHTYLHANCDSNAHVNAYAYAIPHPYTNRHTLAYPDKHRNA